MQNHRSKKFSWQSSFQKLVVILFILNLILCVGYWVQGVFWPLDFIQFFQAHLFAFSFFVMLLASLQNSKILKVCQAIILLVFLFRLIYPIASFSRFDSGLHKGVNRFLLSYNLDHDNRRRGDLLRYLQEEKPSLVFLYEVTGGWKWYLENKLSKKLYPYQYFYPSEKENGVALLSRFPLDAAGVWFFDDRTPFLYAEIEPDEFGIDFDQKIYTFGIRLPKHLEGAQQVYQLHKKYFYELQRLILNLNGPVIVAGDFNQSLYSPLFQHFILLSGMKVVDARLPYLFTWPVDSPFLASQLDYVLATKDILPRLTSVSTIRLKGSDHYPLLLQSFPAWKREPGVGSAAE